MAYQFKYVDRRCLPAYERAWCAAVLLYHEPKIWTFTDHSVDVRSLTGVPEDTPPWAQLSGIHGAQLIGDTHSDGTVFFIDVIKANGKVYSGRGPRERMSALWSLCGELYGRFGNHISDTLWINGSLLWAFDRLGSQNGYGLLILTEGVRYAVICASNSGIR